MNMRERRIVIEAGETPDRFPVHGIHPWRETLLRWEREGKPKEQHHDQLLGLDQDYDTVHLPVNLGMAPLFDVIVLSRDATHVTVRDEFGVVRRMPESDYLITDGTMMKTGLTSGMSEFLSYPMTDRDSWERLKAEHFSRQLSARVPENWEELVPKYREIAKEKYLLTTGYPIMGAIGGLRQMMGLENLIFSLADEPDWIRRAWRELIELWISIFDQLLRDVQIDHMVFFEDMCGTSGPLMSPKMFIDFFGEGYRELISFLKERGVRLIDLDSDGNTMLMLPSFVSMGVNLISPCQASAGMDPEVVRRQYPSLMVRGGINHAMLATGDRDIIFDEVRRKYSTAWRLGRYIPQPEHSIPPTVSWDSIRYFADACLQYSTKAP